MFERGFEKSHTILHSCFLNIFNSIVLRLFIKVAMYISVRSAFKGTPLQSDGVKQEKRGFGASIHILCYLNDVLYRLAINIST